VSVATSDVLTPILCYHGVGDQLPSDELPFAFPVDVFASHLDEIAARGLRTVTVSELTRFRRAGDAEALGATIAITFDDGYADLLSTVAPLLAGRKIVATRSPRRTSMAGASALLATNDGSAGRKLPSSRGPGCSRSVVTATTTSSSTCSRSVTPARRSNAA
jgi:hypothetical protein